MRSERWKELEIHVALNKKKRKRKEESVSGGKETYCMYSHRE